MGTTLNISMPSMCRIEKYSVKEIQAYLLPHSHSHILYTQMCSHIPYTFNLFTHIIFTSTYIQVSLLKTYKEMWEHVHTQRHIQA